MLRPSCSTSGGQSAGRGEAVEVVLFVVVVLLVVLLVPVEEEGSFRFPVMAAQSAADMQVRQLLC